MRPGGFVKDPISAISFGMALMFGTAGLPHILMRFFTVPDAKQARKSVFWATTWIGYFYVLIFFIGFGAITMVLTNPEFADTAKGVINGGAGAANMAAVLVAKSVGGNVFYGFISAVAFATILAVVAGLTLSGASAVSHDLYATVFKKGKADSASELKVSRMTTLALGVVAVILGIVFEKQNIAFMVSLAFAIAASANFPVLFLSVLWKGCTTKGAVIGGFLGLVSSVGLTVISPAVWEAVLGNPKGSALFPYTSPALFSMTIGFVGIWLFSVLDRSSQASNGTGGIQRPAGPLGDRAGRGGGFRTLRPSRVDTNEKGAASAAPFVCFLVSEISSAGVLHFARTRVATGSSQAGASLRRVNKRGLRRPILGWVASPYEPRTQEYQIMSATRPPHQPCGRAPGKRAATGWLPSTPATGARWRSSAHSRRWSPPWTEKGRAPRPAPRRRPSRSSCRAKLAPTTSTRSGSCFPSCCGMRTRRSCAPSADCMKTMTEWKKPGWNSSRMCRPSRPGSAHGTWMC